MDEKKEIEWQFEVKNLEHLKELLLKFFSGCPYIVHPKEAEVETDSYFDTDDFMFQNAGFSLRIRRKKSDYETTVKSLSDQDIFRKSSPRSRIEITEKVGGTNARHLLAKKKGQIASLIRSKHPKAKLIKLFVLEVEREKWAVFLGERPLVEIALDRGHQVDDPHSKKPLSILRLEIEVKSQSLFMEAESLVKKLEKYLRRHDRSFKRARDGKFDLAMKHNALRGINPQFGEVAFKKNSAIEHYVVQIFKKYFSKAFLFEASCRLGFDPEAVHQMRVALRKILSAMKVFFDYLPPDFLTYRPFLKELILSLGKVRDLDVEIAGLHQSSILKNYENGDGIDEIIDFLKKKREVAHKQLLRTMNGKNYGLMVNDLQVWLNSDDLVQETSFLARDISKTLIKKQLDKFKKRGEKINKNSKPKSFHKLRIEGKKLRYALEFLQPIYKGKINKLISLMASLQKKLGLINDCRVAKEKLLRLTNTKTRHFSSLAFYKMGQVSAHYVVTQKEQMRKFMEQFKEVDWLSLKNNL